MDGRDLLPLDDIGGTTKGVGVVELSSTMTPL